jgi:hypothetical protein
MPMPVKTTFTLQPKSSKFTNNTQHALHNAKQTHQKQKQERYNSRQFAQLRCALWRFVAEQEQKASRPVALVLTINLNHTVKTAAVLMLAADG